MKILLIKLSSIGDLLHAFPALTQLQHAYPELEVTWVVESAFKEVPLWHPAVKHIIPAPLRQIKKEGFGLKAVAALLNLAHTLRQERYDYVIDAQGLFKSAWMAKVAKGKSIGFGRGSAREAVWWLYNQRVDASWDWHAIARIEALVSPIIPARISKDAHVDYALAQWQPHPNKILLFVHGTTWESKHYPDELWLDLVKLATAKGYQVWLPHSNERELKRAQYLQCNAEVKILPKMSLTALKDQLYQVSGVISVDTGLAHIAAALGVPNVTLYGPTDPAKIGTIGRNQVHMTSSVSAIVQHDKKSTFQGFKVLLPEEILARLINY